LRTLRALSAYQVYEFTQLKTNPGCGSVEAPCPGASQTQSRGTGIFTAD
jgi:hypothetical protein